MKVLLVEPPFSPFDVPAGFVGFPEPLALESIAAKLCKNHDVTILDMRIEDKLDYYIHKYQPNVIGTGGVTANLFLCKDILKKAKQYDPRIMTIMGGHHVTFMPQDAKEAYIDIVVIGEGDYSATEVIDAFEQKKNFENIPGLEINRNGKQIFTNKRELINMDELLIPARHLTKKYRGFYFQRTHTGIISINTSRGCPYRCSFCTIWKMYGGKYRVRKADLVVDEMEQCIESFIDFIDDNSIENIQRTQKIAELIYKKGLKKQFKVYARADTIARNPETIEMLANVGLKMILVGFESIRADDFKKWNKKSDTGINQKAIEILQKNGIEIISYFVVNPEFLISDFENLWTFVDDMNLSDPIFTILVPFHGTELYEKEKKNILYHDYRLFDFFHTVLKTSLPLNEFYSQFSMLYQRAYAKARQVKLLKKVMNNNLISKKNERFSKIFERLLLLEEHHKIIATQINKTEIGMF